MLPTEEEKAFWRKTIKSWPYVVLQSTQRGLIRCVAYPLYESNVEWFRQQRIIVEEEMNLRKAKDEEAEGVEK